MTLTFQNFSSYHSTQQQLQVSHSQQKSRNFIPTFRCTKLDKQKGLETVPEASYKLVNCSHDVFFPPGRDHVCTSLNPASLYTHKVKADVCQIL